MDRSSKQKEGRFNVEISVDKTNKQKTDRKTIEIGDQPRKNKICFT